MLPSARLQMPKMKWPDCWTCSKNPNHSRPGSIQSNLAVLEERRSAAGRELNTLRQQAADLEERGRRTIQQIGEAEQQQAETRQSIASLGETVGQLVIERDRLSVATIEMAA